MASQRVTIDIGASARDRWLETLKAMGYAVTRHRPGSSCMGRIVEGSGTTVHYEAEVSEVRLSYDPPQQDMVDTVMVFAKEAGGSLRA